MKKTNQNTSGTSFFNVTILTTVNKLIQAIGEPDYEDVNPGSDKVNYEWDCETDSGAVFTIYDWKEYREFSKDETIEFHIGGFNRWDTETGKRELLTKLNK